jgi:hypothetical protein
MRFLGAVVAVVVGRIAPQLARNRAAVAPQHAGHLGRRITAPPLCRNQVSFFLGELVIRHGCNPFPGRMRRQLVSPLPTFVQRVLHLLCESAGTPTTVIRNNRTGASEAVVGALPADALVPVIDRMLNAKP